ncbi:MAG: glycosyltransferase family 39 protein [Chloroflexi bacterium]|nr:glycosyltransferase family 39 protein [Chloroflexota bacterium]
MLSATPALAWVFFGLGLPWALVALPRADWRDRPVVALLALAFGPALLTAWMFVLGSLPVPSLRLEWILAGTAALAAPGWALLWRKRTLIPIPSASGKYEKHGGLAPDEKLLIALVAAALVVRWLSAAYWPFTAYDALWVYGYEGRLYTLTHTIPASIGYYPQFLPLQYTYLQLAIGDINDHAARAVIPFLHLGSILAAYTLGSRLFTRRVGIYTAAIWALYPHVGQWSRFGDLEIPTTFMFTAAAAFFLMAWRAALPVKNSELGTRNYSVIAGLLLGIGMWTKPTMGAFIWGVALLAAVEAARWWYARRFVGTCYGVSERMRVVLWAAVACIPLGAAWYVRNLLLGHPVITMPPGFWLTLAARSGAELGWPLLAVILLVGYMMMGSRVKAGIPQRVSLPIASLPGLALVLAAALPSILSPRRMEAPEWLLLAAGVALLAGALRKPILSRWPDEAAKIGWALLLALPYFVTWFYSYSYHYRLSFPIVPLMILPTAVIAAAWTRGLWQPRERGAGGSKTGGFKTLPYGPVRRIVYLALVCALAAPGVVSALYDLNAGWDWLWTDKLPDDASRYASGNEALMNIVNGLRVFEQEQGRPPVVAAPGIVRLPFFMPLADVRTQAAPTRLSDLDGVDYFIYGVPETGGVYDGIPPRQNQALSALARADYDPTDTIMRLAWWRDDSVFNYTVYELHLENRFVRPKNGVPPAEGDVVFGGFARLLGHNIGGDYFWPGRKLVMNLFWEVLAPADADYMVYIHLRDENGQVWDSWDGPVTRSNDGNYYSTLVWEPGEFIADKRELVLRNAETPVGDKTYRIVIGLYDLADNRRLPVTINGEPAGDGYMLAEKISIVPGQE